jgi:hypothetical protein
MSGFGSRDKKASMSEVGASGVCVCASPSGAWRRAISRSLKYNLLKEQLIL